jgi:hypothetical protein
MNVANLCRLQPKCCSLDTRLTIESSLFTVDTAKNVSAARVKCVLRIMVKQIECSTGVLTAKFATPAQVQVGM